MKHRHVERYVRERPWAILPGALEAIMEILAMSELGERSQEEIQAAIEAARERSGGNRETSTLRVGSTAIVPIYGVIMPRASMFEVSQSGTSLETLRNELDELGRDDGVKSIVLDVNSPGGSTELLTETAGEIRELRSRKPVIAVSNSMAASAAYHLASQASELFVTPSGLVGSVGVYATHQDLSAKQEQAGIKTTFIQAGKRKTEGNPFEPLSEQAKAQIQMLVNEHYRYMTADIAAGRRVAEGFVRGERFGEGAMFPAVEAVRRGMADGVQTFDETVSTVLATGVSGRSAARVEPAASAPADPAIAALIETPPPWERTFSDAVDVALRACDAVVTDAEALRALTASKREQLIDVANRAIALSQSGGARDDDELASEAGDDAGVNVDGEALEAEARAAERLAVARFSEGR